MVNTLLVDRMDDSNASFAFDIEIAPNFPVIDTLFERVPFVDGPYEPQELKLGNAKKPDTIARLKREHAATEAQRKAEWNSALAKGDREAEHDEKQETLYDEFITRSLLRAERARVLCIAYCYPAENGLNQFVDWSPETELLANLWDRCHDAQRRGGIIYTASGTQWDLRMCWRRSLLTGLKIPCQTINWYRGRAYPDESFIDVSEVFAAGEYGHKVKVDHLAAGFGVDRKTGDHGKTFWRLADEDRTQAEEYAKRDAKIAWDLGQKMPFIRRNQYSEPT